MKTILQIMPWLDSEINRDNIIAKTLIISRGVLLNHTGSYCMLQQINITYSYDSK